MSMTDELVDNTKDCLNAQSWHELKSSRCAELEKNIDAAFAGIEKNYLKIACALYEINKNRLFVYSGRCDGIPYSMTDYSFRVFGLKKSQTYAYISIIERFGNVLEDGSCFRLKKEFSKYTVSKLIRLLDVPDERLQEFNPDMTVKEIIEKKNRLKETIILERSRPEQMVLPVEEDKSASDEFDGLDIVADSDDRILIGKFEKPLSYTALIPLISRTVESLKKQDDFRHRKYHFEISLCWDK